MGILSKNQRYEEFTKKLWDFMYSSLSEEVPADIVEKTWYELALELYQLQAEFVGPYKNLCRYRFSSDYLNRKFEHLSQIPSIPTSAFKEFEVTALDPAERTSVFYSSGTTYEKPSRHFHSHYSLKIYEESLLLWFKKCIVGGFKSDQITPITKPHELLNSGSESPNSRQISFIFLTPSPDFAPHSSLVHMFNTLKSQLGSVRSDFYGKAENQTSWTIDFKRLLESLNLLQYTHPIIICGTAFNYVHLIEYFEKHKIRFQLPPNTVIFETGGYKGRSREIPKSELYKKIVECFGVNEDRIVSEYGMSELSSQAYDRILTVEKNAMRKFKFPPWAKFSIVSPETKEPVEINKIGILRIYDLANVYSAFAIQTDDLALNLGDGFMLVGRTGTSEPRGCSLLVEN